MEFDLKPSDTAAKASGLGTLGYASYGGGRIYGEFEAGFGQIPGQQSNFPEPCTVAGVAYCQGGIDVPMCDRKLAHEYFLLWGLVFEFGWIRSPVGWPGFKVFARSFRKSS